MKRSRLARLDVDERGLYDLGVNETTADVHLHRRTFFNLGGKQGEGDAVLEGRRHRSGGHLTDLISVCVPHNAVLTWDAASGDLQPARNATGPFSLFGDKGVLAPEGVLLPTNCPAGTSLDRGDVKAEVLPVQRVTHFSAERVTRAEATRQTVVGLGCFQQRVEELGSLTPRDDEFVATLAGVARAAHDDRSTVPIRLGEAHVVVVNGQAEGGHHLVRLRPLDGQNTELGVDVRDLNTFGCGFLQSTNDLSGVGGVRNQEEVVVRLHVDDEVINDTTFLVAAHRVLRLTRSDATQVVRQAGVDELEGTRTTNRCLAEVAHIEDSDGFTHTGVLAQGAATGVLDGHVPATKVGHLGPQLTVTSVNGGKLCFSHSVTVPRVKRWLGDRLRADQICPHSTKEFSVTEVVLSHKELAPADFDALAVLVVKEGDSTRVVTGCGLPEELVASINAQLVTLKASGKADETLKLIVADVPGYVLAVGAGGDEADVTANPDLIRSAAGAAARALGDTAKVGFAFGVNAADLLDATAQGVLLGGYVYNAYKTKPQATLESVTLHVSADIDNEENVVAEAKALADAQNWARDLVNMPPLDLHPAAFADLVTERFASTDVKVSVMDEKQLAEANCGGLVGVGRGSTRPPRLVTLSYSPDNAERHIAIVGKGITFDSGGLCIKPASGMATMKCDMAGAAAVAGYVQAAATLKLPVAITGYLCLAENMTGADAQRPGDVVTMHNGTTVEIDNTDAEGRLVMADGLSYASELQPDLIIDIATLTGAAVLALGNRTAAVVGNNDDVRDEVIAASERAGEPMWPMPLLEHIRPSLDSDIADIKHTGERMGGLITAALFLQAFVGDNADGAQTDWVHMDIAAPAFNEGSAYGFTPKGGTGFAVRSLIELTRA